MLRFAGILALIAAFDASLFFLGVMDYGPVLGWSVLVGTAAAGLCMLARGCAFRFDRRVDDPAPKELLLEPLGTVLSGFFLLLPGPVSDCVGVLLLIRPLRHVIAALLLRVLGREAFVGNRWSIRFDEDEEGGGRSDRPGAADPAQDGLAEAASAPGAASGDGTATDEGADRANGTVRDVAFEVLEDENSSPRP